MNKKVLIIGGNGFIGSNIADYLSKNNIIPEIYDLFQKDNGYTSYQGNILTDDRLDEIIKQYDTIIYLVTSVSPKKSMEFPEESYTQDIPMLLKVLDSCVKNGKTKKIIFSSSGGTVYGEGLNRKLCEEGCTEEPINHYAICKLACEKILILYNKLHGMNNVILRISNPYGKGQNPSSGVGVITTFVDKIINGEKITLYGDGTVVRDFVDIEFVCNAFLKAILWENDENINPVFNVGSGKALNLNDIINIISKTLGVNPDIEYLPERTFDVKYNVLNMEKSKKVLGLDVSDDFENKIIDYIKECTITRKR